MSRILIAGESWITATTHTKGVDEFTAHSYTEGVAQLRAALEAGGHEVVHLPAHLVSTQFPETPEQLGEYDVVVLSDIGVNSLQLSPGVFERSVPGRDRVQELASWVRAGGALLMVGGYLSFSGWQGRAGFARTEIEEVLPVEMLVGDDRVERPAGVVATVVGEAGAGRTAVFTSDCSPHWAPPAFCEEWPGYARVFQGLVSWLTSR